jgi:tRNA-2-methylthio-N6-dimethylallyladenosine synthase
MDGSDLVLINTCSVREHAEHKVHSLLGRLREWKEVGSERRIGICGCMAQAHGALLLEEYPFVDFILGTGRPGRLPGILAGLSGGSARPVETGSLDGPWEETPVLRSHGVKAWVTAMEGCDLSCSYCIVPRVRGRQRSRSREQVVREATDLTAGGTREIMLLGQTVNAWGRDLHPRQDLADLLEDLDQVPELLRIRFMSPHPVYLTEPFLRRISALSKVCEHFHLPVQSGSDRVLRAMRRGYTRKAVLEKVAGIRRVFPGAAVTTDFIVGFPGEDDSDFRDSLSLVREAGFDGAYSFKFSPRPGTDAAALPDQVPEAVKKERLDALLGVVEAQNMEQSKDLQGRTVDILIEERQARGEDESVLSGTVPWIGSTRTAKRVMLEGPADILGRIVTVRIVEVLPWTLKAVLIRS